MPLRCSVYADAEPGRVFEVLENRWEFHRGPTDSSCWERDPLPPRCGQRSRTRHSGRTRPAATIADDAGLCKRCFVPAAAGCATCWLLLGGCTLVTICMMLQQVVCCTLDFARRMRTSACLGRARPVDFRVDFKFRSAIYAQARPSISIPDGMRVRVRADRVRPTSQFQSSASAGL